MFSWNETEREEPASLDDETKLKAWENRAMFDADGAAFLNEKVPLSVLKKAAMSSQLPAPLKKMLVTAVWTRAFILKNTEVEREFAPIIASYTKDSMPLFGKYSTAVGAADRESSALVAIMRNPHRAIRRNWLRPGRLSTGRYRQHPGKLVVCRESRRQAWHLFSLVPHAPTDSRGSTRKRSNGSRRRIRDDADASVDRVCRQVPRPQASARDTTPCRQVDSIRLQGRFDGKIFQAGFPYPPPTLQNVGLGKKNALLVFLILPTLPTQNAMQVAAFFYG